LISCITRGPWSCLNPDYLFKRDIGKEPKLGCDGLREGKKDGKTNKQKTKKEKKQTNSTKKQRRGEDEGIFVSNGGGGVLGVADGVWVEK